MIQFCLGHTSFRSVILKCPQGTFGNIWRQFWSSDWGKSVLMTCSGRRSGLLLMSRKPSATSIYLTWNVNSAEVKNPALHLKSLDQSSYPLLPTLSLVGYPRTPSCAYIHRPTTLYCNCPLARRVLRTRNVLWYSRVQDREYSSKKQFGTVCTGERKCCIGTLNSATY